MRYRAKNRKAGVQATNTIMIILVGHIIMLRCRNISLLTDRRFSAAATFRMEVTSEQQTDSLLRHGSAHRHLSRSFPVFSGENASELYPRLPTTYIRHLATLIISEIEETSQGQTTFINWHILKPRKEKTKNCLDHCSSYGGTRLLVSPDSRMGGT